MNASSRETYSSGFLSDKGNANGLENDYSKTRNDQSSEKQSSTYDNESSRLGNKYNERSNSGDDTDIRPSYDTESMVEVPQDYNASFAVPCLFIHFFMLFPCLYIRLLSVMLSRISFHVLYGRSFKTLCLLNYALMKRHDYDITVFSTKRGVTIMVSEPGYETVGSKDLTCEDWMVNTRTDADLSAAVQNALQTLLPQIRAEIREEFRTSFGPSDAGGNPPSVTIHTWLERFNKQNPRSFEKATAPVDTENWISHMEKIFDVMGCEDAFKTRLTAYKFEELKKLFFLQFFPRAEQERLKREYHSIRQTNTETNTEFIQHFLRVAGFLGTVANAARNYEILHKRDDDDAKRPDKRRVVIGISRPLNRVVTGTTVIITIVMDKTDEAIVTTTAAATITTLATTTTGIPVMGVTRETGVSSPTDLPILVPSSLGVPLRATPTQFALRVDADTQESVV
nr:hypothetical protein [Tanacetum cinerariifolium]